MSETFFEELKRYVRFGPEDEQALIAFAPLAAPHYPHIAAQFYERLIEHEGARKVFQDEAQIERLKGTLQEWLRLLLQGPWDEDYYQLRARIGRVHVKIALPQHFMFGAMDLIRIELARLAHQGLPHEAGCLPVTNALHKILDIELAIMLESYREAFVEKVQYLERLEKANLERELTLSAVRTRRAERLAALGTMAAGLAHEIRNPLNAAHIQLTVAQRRLSRGSSPETESARSAIDLAGGEMARLAALVEDFLQFARPQPLRLAPADLRATVEVTMALLSPEASAAGVELILDPGEAMRFELDDEKMKQVLHNLLRNAIEAVGRGGHVRVTANANRGVATLAVEDNGQGLPSDAPIFEPFFTTKEQGTGLGLAIVHRIVADHGGTVDVESRPGRTVFTISLPMVQPAGPDPMNRRETVA